VYRRGDLLRSADDYQGRKRSFDPATQEVQEANRTSLSGQAEVWAMHPSIAIEILDIVELATSVDKKWR